MKLHLASEDISIHLEEQATRASQRIPATIRELLHIKDDVLSVRGAVTTTLSQLERDTSATPAATSAVSALEELDAVKRRMEDACNTLKVSQHHRHKNDTTLSPYSKDILWITS